MWFYNLSLFFEPCNSPSRTISEEPKHVLRVPLGDAIWALASGTLRKIQKWLHPLQGISGLLHEIYCNTKPQSLLNL
jgi:hypothetical protein